MNYYERVIVLWYDIIILILSLFIILLSCELFTNGIEWMGSRLKLGDGIVGSVFSAVGTCLPETLIPIIAIFWPLNNKKSIDIGIGAIVGAPFMLATLAFFITGLSVLIFCRKRATGIKMKVNKDIIKRDIGFFVLSYSSAIYASFAPNQSIKYAVCIALIIVYIYYLICTARKDKFSHRDMDNLYFSEVFRMRARFRLILLQVAVALTGIIIGASLFVEKTGNIAERFKLPVLILSLIITPIATELPEKFNSVLWIGKNKDTLAMGNITGAMVFQSCIPVVIGILATPWRLDSIAIISSLLALASASITYLYILLRRKLTPVPLIMGGIFYGIYIMYITW